MRIERFLGAAILLGFSQTAMAADMPNASPGVVARPAPKSETNWFLHVGPGGVILDESAKMTALGAPIPGATIKIDPQLTAVVEAGYFFSPEWALSFTGGIPPRIEIRGAGTAGGYGVLGKATYGPATLTTHYHFRGFGAIQPYVGGGIAFMKIFDTKDGSLANLKVKDTIGPALQIGVDIMLNEKWGAFIDVKKAFLRTKATGSLGGAPVSAKVTMDPLVLHSGVAYRF